MDTITLLAIAALVCVIGVAVFTACAIRWRNEDWAIFLVIGAFICGGGAAWCIQEAVKRGDAREQQRPVIPVDAKPAQ